MRKERRFPSIAFSEKIIRLASDEFTKSIYCKDSGCSLRYTYIVGSGNIEWSHDSWEEFFASYRAIDFSADYYLNYVIETFCHVQYISLNLSVIGVAHGTTVTVSAKERSEIEAVHSVFENASSEDRVSLEESELKPVVFIGHGRNPLWRELKDHLQDMHGYSVEAYEVGARAGHTIRDILDSMLDNSSFAFLVMTAEDEMSDGTYQPRMNVIHELGLFQGKLGWPRGIMLLEEGAEDFSNMSGIHQLRFSQGNIREVFGDVLATLKREFPS